MAWRIGPNVVRGEIDNRVPGIITGTIYLEGIREPLCLELEGNCWPDLAGRYLIFRNLLAPLPDKSLEALKRLQCGDAGEMTGERMARIPTIPPEELHRCMQEHKPIPTRWSESLYLEWFAGNGRVLIEGSSFTCRLSPAKWRLSEEEHRQKYKFVEPCLDDDFPEEAAETEAAEETNPPPTGRREAAHVPPLLIETIDGKAPHPLVRRMAEFLFRTILESKKKKFWADDSLEAQPVEDLLDAAVRATVRLAKTLSDPSGSDTAAIICGLRQARWSMAQASEHAGLAKYLCSADPEWLTRLEEELRRFRNEVRRVILDFEEQARTVDEAHRAPAKPVDVNPAEPAAAAPDSIADVPH